MQGIFGLLSATLFYPDTSPIGCDYHFCLKPLAYVFVVFITPSYCSVILMYTLLGLRVHYRNKGCDSDENELKHSTERERNICRERNVRTLNRLSFSMCTFTM